MTANDIIKILQKRHASKGADEWAHFEELKFGTGSGMYGDSRIDFYALNLWPSKNRIKISYEIKVSKTDLKKDLENPYKQFPALQVSNEFYYIYPKGMVRPDEVALYGRGSLMRDIVFPEWAGVIEVHPTEPWHKSWVVKPAPFRQVDSIPWTFVSSISRRACRSEALLRERGGEVSFRQR